jgi:hypothetical protein
MKAIAHARRGGWCRGCTDGFSDAHWPGEFRAPVDDALRARTRLYALFLHHGAQRLVDGVLGQEINSRIPSRSLPAIASTGEFGTQGRAAGSIFKSLSSVICKHYHSLPAPVDPDVEASKSELDIF